MKDFDYQQLDEIIHSRIRLAIMSVLISLNEAEFKFLKEKVHTRIFHKVRIGSFSTEAEAKAFGENKVKTKDINYKVVKVK